MTYGPKAPSCEPLKGDIVAIDVESWIKLHKRPSNGHHVINASSETALRFVHATPQLQMLLFPNALCCSLYERNCVCAVTNFLRNFYPQTILPTSAGAPQRNCGVV